MSSEFRPLNAVLFAEVFDGRMKRHEIEGEVLPGASRGLLVGPDGRLEVWREEDGTCTFSRRTFEAMAWAVLDALDSEFGLGGIVGEEDYRFWGFSTEAEFEKHLNDIHEKYEDQLYEDLLRYIRGEPNGIMPGRIGEGWAKAAKLSFSKIRP